MFLLPDPLCDARQLSAATLLWFDAPIMASIPPTIVTKDAFEIVDLAQERQPEWWPRLRFALDGWSVAHEGARKARRVLEPVADRLKSAWMVYPADSAAMERADALIRESTFGLDELSRMIEPGLAGGELLRAALLDGWLEAGEDLDAFYKSCASIFARGSFQRRLVQAYLLRFAAFGETPSALLLSNERLLPLLERFAPAEPQQRQRSGSGPDDVVAFEIFRQILSPQLDPLDEHRVQVVAQILADRTSELEALKGQCDRLSEQIASTPAEDLSRTVEVFVRRHVADDIASVLRLSGRAREEFIAQLLVDRVGWVAALTATTGVAAGGPPGVSLAGGVAVIATLISKGFDVGWSHHKELRDNPYRLFRHVGSALPGAG